LSSTFFFYCSRHHPDLPSFPTRRSSDLSGRRHPGVDRADDRADEEDGGDQMARRMDLLAERGHGLPRWSARGIEQRPCCDVAREDRKSTRLNSSHLVISYAVFCLKKKKK